MDDYEYQKNWLYQSNINKKSCTCGCHKTFGTDCNPEFHSEWCEYSPNYKHETFSEDTFPDHFD